MKSSWEKNVHMDKIWSVFQAAGPWEDGPAVHDEMAESDDHRQHSQKRTIASSELARSRLLEQRRATWDGPNSHPRVRDSTRTPVRLLRLLKLGEERVNAHTFLLIAENREAHVTVSRVHKGEDSRRSSFYVARCEMF